MIRVTHWMHHTTTLWNHWPTQQLVQKSTTSSQPMKTQSRLGPNTHWTRWPRSKPASTTMEKQMLLSNMNGALNHYLPFRVKLTPKLLTKVPNLDLHWLSSHDNNFSRFLNHLYIILLAVFFFLQGRNNFVTVFFNYA